MSRTIRKCNRYKKNGKRKYTLKLYTGPNHPWQFRIDLWEKERGLSYPRKEYERIKTTDFGYYGYGRYIGSTIIDDTDNIKEHCRTNYLRLCRKNKTCRRQRKNAVRITKRLVHKSERMKNKIDTRNRFKEYIRYNGDIGEFFI